MSSLDVQGRPLVPVLMCTVVGNMGIAEHLATVFHETALLSSKTFVLVYFMEQTVSVQLMY